MADDMVTGMSRAAADEFARAKARRELVEADVAHEKGKLEAEKLMLEIQSKKLSLAKEKRAEKADLARDCYHYSYAFTELVSGASVQKCIDQLNAWSRQQPGCDLEIVFCSQGGSVIDGMRLFDYILWLRKKGHKITTAALGEAASMAGILLQAGDVRVMGREAWVLIHEAAFGAQGKTGDMEDRVKWVKRVQERILNIFAERSQGCDPEKPLTKQQIKTRWHKTDWWLSSEECLKHGIVDEVR